MSSYTVPSVVEATARGERVSDVISRLLSDRIVLIGTPIDDGVATVVIAQLLHLAGADAARDVQLYVNCPGGSPSATLAIHDTMRFVSPDVATICVGQAAGPAALLVAAGADGKRAILPHARVRLEQPSAGGRRGSMSDLALEAAELARRRGEAERILADRTGHDVERIRRDTDRAMVLDAREAVAYGLVDRVAEPAPSGSQELRARRALRPDRGELEAADGGG